MTGSYDKQLITWHMNSNEPLSVLEGERVADLAVRCAVFVCIYNVCVYI